MESKTGEALMDNELVSRKRKGDKRFQLKGFKRGFGFLVFYFRSLVSWRMDSDNGMADGCYFGRFFFWNS